MLFLIIALKYNFHAKTKLLNTKTKTSFIVLHKNTLKWDFSNYAINNKPYIYTERSKNLTYFIRFAKELDEYDLPDYADFNKIKSHFGTNAVRCNSYTRTCDILSTIYEYDWTTFTDENPELGVLYFSNSQPFLNSKKAYEEWEVRFEFKCNETSKSENPNFVIDSPIPNLKRFHLIFSNKLSCGTSWTVDPTPTPMPFNPDCNVYYRQYGEKNLAIHFNLLEWNGGALGIPVYINNTGNKKVLFWQPCERMVNCPWGYNCTGSSMSTAWLCDEELKCQNFTIIRGGDDSFVNVDLIDEIEINKGIRISYDDADDSKLQVDITCINEYPNDHVLFNPNGIYDETNNLLKIYGSSYDVCPKEFPEPIPPVDKCRYNLTQAGPKGDYFIDLDLAAFAKESKKVEVLDDGENKEMMLHFAPCDMFPCPDGYDCNGDEDEDLTVLLCEIQNETQSIPPVCFAYGIFDYGINVALKSGYIGNGASTFYFGNRGRTAVVDWKCNTSMLSHKYILPDKVYLRNGKLFIDVQSIEACTSGQGPFPTPPPIVRPDIPEEIFPTPSPVPSPEVMYFFEDISQDKYVNIDLSMLESVKSFIGENTLFVNGSRGTIHTEFHPWNLLKYPANWGESTVFDKANFWQCWYDNDFNPYCHPVADKRLPGLNVTLQKPNDIDSGVKIVYNGSFDASLEIDIGCDHSKTSRFDIADQFIYYNHTGESHKWFINTSFELACPCEYKPAYTPYPSLTPSPSGDTPETYYRAEIGGYIVELDLNKIKSIDGYVASGYSDVYSRNELLFSPIDKLDCPTGKECPDYREGNIWICVNGSTYCYPIGNMDYGLTIRKLCNDDPYCGITAGYNGGLYGSEVHLNFYCDESLPEDEIRLKPIDISVPPGKIHEISLMTSQVCPKNPIPTPSLSLSPSESPVTASLSPTKSPVTASLSPSESPLTASLSPSESPVTASLSPTKSPLTASLSPSESPLTASLSPSKSTFTASLSASFSPTSNHSNGINIKTVLIITISIIVILLIIIAVLVFIIIKNKKMREKSQIYSSILD